MSTELVPYTTQSIVTPLSDPEGARAAIEQYEALKAAIIQPRDVYRETRKDRDGNEKEVEYLKKSFWRRVATCFGLSLELVSETREKDEKGALAYSVYYCAVAPNGRTMIGDGYCSRSEPGKGYWSEHNVRATAHTRAKNRAISDMVGGGEVSYEEMVGEDETEKPRVAQPAQRQISAPRVVEEAKPSPKPSAAPAPLPSYTRSGGDMDRPAFISAIEQMGLNPKEAMDRLGVRSLSGINLREALDTLAGVVPDKEEEPADTPNFLPPDEIEFVEEDHSQDAKDADVAQDASAAEPEPFNPLSDMAFRKLCNAAGLKSVGAVEDFLSATLGEPPYDREQAIAKVKKAKESADRTPDLNTLPAKAVH